MTEHTKENSTRADLRDRIISTATEAFTTHGIKCITMDDIAASLGISKRTLYEVFQDKESLLMECILKDQRELGVFLEEVLASSKNVLEVILVCYQRSIERFHNTNKRFFEDLKKYPKVYEMMRNYRDKDSESTINFFKTGVSQGIFRDDVNFAIVNLLVHEQLDMLMNTDICKEHSFLEVYESIMFTYIRGISTEKGAKVLEDFIKEYRKHRIYREEKH
ncbi:TetR/AcrR family transcriptional regulator [Bacteroides sp.]